VATISVTSSTQTIQVGSNGVAAVVLSGPVGPTGTTGATGATGPAGADGSDGADGADGKSVLNGSGAPGDGTGVDGDFYIDTAADAIYGPKAGGTWTGTGPTSLVGPTGATGATGAAGADGADGTDGDTAVTVDTVETGTTDTLALADAYKAKRYSNASQVTVTVPTSTFSAGDWVVLISTGAGGLTLSTTGITLEGSSPNVTIAQNEWLEVLFTDTDTIAVAGGTS